MNRREMLEKANTLFAEAKGLLERDEIDAQDAERRDKLIVEAKDWHRKAAELKEIEQAALEFKAFQDDTKKGAQPGTPQIENLGQWLVWNYRYYSPRYKGRADPAQIMGKEFDLEDGEPVGSNWLAKKGSQEIGGKQAKDLLEQAGRVPA